MNVENKIFNFIASQTKGNSKSIIGNIEATKSENNLGEKLLYVEKSNLQETINGINFSNNSIFYGFNIYGDYVGCIKVSVLNNNPPDTVEIEYYSNEQFKNQGNITALAKEVIQKIFCDLSFDGLLVNNSFKQSKSNINSVYVNINKDNYASLRVAQKLGFDENGYLLKNDYFLLKEKNNKTR